MKHYVQQINFKNGTTVFSRQDLLNIPDFKRTQVDRNISEHLKRGGIFRPFKNAKGKEVRGKFVLKLEFRLSKPEQEPDPIPQVQITTMVRLCAILLEQTIVFVMLCSFNNSFT